MSPEAFHAAALPYIRQAVQNPALSTEEIAGLLQARCERLTDIPEKLDFFDALPDYDAGLFTNKKSKTNPEVSRRMLEAVLPALEGLADWTVDRIHDALIGLAESLEVKNATLMRRGGDLPHSGEGRVPAPPPSWAGQAGRLSPAVNGEKNADVCRRPQ